MGVSFTLRVRYAETDQMQRAYYARYFEWFEVARTEFCRARGIDYRAMEAQGLFLPIVEAACRYQHPVQYDDELTIQVFVQELTRRTLKMGYRIACQGKPVAHGETTQILIDRVGKPRTFPMEIAALFRG
jgi:acyl-CoA thioester hydrolase